MGIEIESRCDKCDLLVEIPTVDDATTRNWDGKLVLCEGCAQDFDTLVNLMDREDGAARNLLFNIWFRKGMAVGIISNYE